MRKDLNRAIDKFYRRIDPWGYEDNPDDTIRKGLMLEVIAKNKPERVLDIGCGTGFITRDIEATFVLGADISKNAIDQARRYKSPPHVHYINSSLFDLDADELGTFDTIIITGVLYSQYIGRSQTLVYQIVDRLLARRGCLIATHICEWYTARFPYPRVTEREYPYRGFTHLLEVYRK